MVSGIRLLLNAIDKQYEIVLSSFFIRRQFEVYLAFLFIKKREKKMSMGDYLKTLCKPHFVVCSKTNQSLICLFFFFLKREKREKTIFHIF